jgi:hypothetical protein
MRKTLDHRTCPMCSVSGPIGQFLHQTRLSDVYMFGLNFFVIHVSKKYLTIPNVHMNVIKTFWTVYSIM